MSRAPTRNGASGTTGHTLLTVDELTVALPVQREVRRVLHGVSIDIAPGEAVGLVGESGSGKSMTARAVARLMPRGAEVGGSVRYDGIDVLALGERELRDYRTQVSVIFQDPRAHINPVRRIGDFMTEVLRTNRGVSRAEASARAVSLLAEVGIDDGQRRLDQYPHELSGGLLQRVMIAAALLTEPRLLLADEPTTALDVTTQAEVMAILNELRLERGLAVLFITHDLDLAAAVCDRTAVMYAGQILETREAGLLHGEPLHPYTAALAAARPSIESTSHRLQAIGGQPLSAFDAPDGCAFALRCPFVEDRCTASRPELRDMSGGEVRCIRAEEIHGALAATPADASRS